MSCPCFKKKAGGLSEDLYNDMFGLDLNHTSEFNTSPFQAAPAPAPGLSVQTDDHLVPQAMDRSDTVSPNPVKRGRRASIENEIGAMSGSPTTADAWMRSIGMFDYWPLFDDAGYDDLDTISDMTQEDITDAGVAKPGHVKKLQKYIAELRTAQGKLPLDEDDGGDDMQQAVPQSSAAKSSSSSSSSSSGQQRQRKNSVENEIEALAVNSLDVASLMGKVSRGSGLSDMSTSDSDSYGGSVGDLSKTTGNPKVRRGSTELIGGGLSTSPPPSRGGGRRWRWHRGAEPPAEPAADARPLALAGRPERGTAVR
eukprot:SAG22_NODE_823_length_6993_cov_6.116913_2_plen_311_part_00